MKRFFFFVSLIGSLGFSPCFIPAQENAAVDIGNRRELFVDNFLVEKLTGGAERRLHHPVPREVVMTFGEDGEPWETNIAYATAIRDGDRILMYYSARFAADFGGKKEPTRQQVACVLESPDGIHFTRPKLGHCDISPFFGEEIDTSHNNVVWRHGPATHNFTPFLDSNPDATSEQRFKAIARPPSGWKGKGALAVFTSPDGFRWEVLNEQGFATQPTDSQNLAFWDPIREHYVAYMRGSSGVRDIRTCISKNLIDWTEPKLVEYSDDRREHMYTPSIQPYFRAPHIYIGTPARFNQRRQKVPDHPHSGVSDAIIMSSRDGKHFDRWEEGFVRPGPEPEVWTDRNNYPGLGFIQTSPTELSLYWTEHYRHASPRLRRGTIRVDGFASIHAGGEPGEMLTRPFIFNGKHLAVNYATSAIGSLQFELCTPDGEPIQGFTYSDSETLFGNEIEHSVTWENTSDLSHLAGRPIRLRVRLHDADLFSIRFAEKR